MVKQKNEAGSSNACELVGLKRTLRELGPERISSIVTDRNRTIAKYLRDNHGNTAELLIKHRYDLWHFAKCKERLNISINLMY